MKMHGKVVQNNNVVYVVIPRSDGDIVFTARPVLSFTRFDELCPVPKPPTITLVSTGQQSPDYEDEQYIERLSKYCSHKTHWLILESLRTTEGLEWETVDYNKPETWEKHLDELLSAGFTPSEINAIHNAATKVNTLDDSQLDEARNRFLASLSPAVAL